MKHCICSLPGLVLLFGAASLNVVGANPPAGYVDFGKFSPQASGGEFVEVNINKNLLAMAGRLTRQREPEICALLDKLHHIRVNVVGLDEANQAEVENRIKSIHSELESPPWQRVVMVREHRQEVQVYLRMRKEEAVEGAVVTVLERGKQAVLVNIVGDIQPEEIAVIGERFNIDPLKKIPGATRK